MLQEATYQRTTGSDNPAAVGHPSLAVGSLGTRKKYTEVSAQVAARKVRAIDSRGVLVSSSGFSPAACSWLDDRPRGRAEPVHAGGGESTICGQSNLRREGAANVFQYSDSIADNGKGYAQASQDGSVTRHLVKRVLL